MAFCLGPQKSIRSFLVNMSTKCDKDVHNGFFKSIILSCSQGQSLKHLRTDFKPHQHDYIPFTTRDDGMINHFTINTEHAVTYQGHVSKFKVSGGSAYEVFANASYEILVFLCRLRSIAAHRDHFVLRLSVCLSVLPKSWKQSARSSAEKRDAVNNLL